MLLDIFLVFQIIFAILNRIFCLMGWKCMDNKFQVLPYVYFGAGLFITFIWKTRLKYLLSLIDNFLKTNNASLYYCFLLVLVLIVNFLFYRQCFQLRFSAAICELKQKATFTGKYYFISICHHIVHIGEKQHTYFVTFPETAIGMCSRKYFWEEQHFH